MVSNGIILISGAEIKGYVIISIRTFPMIAPFPGKGKMEQKGDIKAIILQ